MRRYFLTAAGLLILCSCSSSSKAGSQATSSTTTATAATTTSVAATTVIRPVASSAEPASSVASTPPVLPPSTAPSASASIQPADTEHKGSFGFTDANGNTFTISFDLSGLTATKSTADSEAGMAQITTTAEGSLTISNTSAQTVSVSSMPIFIMYFSLTAGETCFNPNGQVVVGTSTACPMVSIAIDSSFQNATPIDPGKSLVLPTRSSTIDDVSEAVVDEAVQLVNGHALPDLISIVGGPASTCSVGSPDNSVWIVLDSNWQPTEASVTEPPRGAARKPCKLPSQ